MINHLERRLAAMEWTQFLDDPDEQDLTAFRLMQIGEVSRKLPDDLKQRHPQLPWAAIYAMRNIISHDYLGLDLALIWHSATQELGAIKAMARKELDQITT
jgi:uncharacterized protein with HEPN domain